MKKNMREPVGGMALRAVPSAADVIVRTIHCVWFGGAKTKLAEECRASWARFAPDWRVREWNEGNAAELKGLPGRRFFEAALAARKWAMASDWLRMAAVWKEGGAYLDCDVELVGDLTALCEAGEWVASEWTAIGETWLNPGSGFALERGSEVARYMLEAYDRLEFDPKFDMMPWINARLGEAFRARRPGSGSGVRVLPPEVMSPIDFRGKVRRTAATVGIHHYALSWVAPWRKALQWISWHGGRGLIDFALGVRRRIRGK